jgi:hypothetical protein
LLLFLDPGSGMGKNQDPGSGIRDKHPGSATLKIIIIFLLLFLKGQKLRVCNGIWFDKVCVT